MKSLLLGWALGMALVASPAAAQSFPELTGRVVDQADIIPPAEEASLTAQLEQLEKASGHQLVVATVASLEGHDVGDYGYRLGRARGIGGQEANAGRRFLIAAHVRRRTLRGGSGIEPTLNHHVPGRDLSTTGH